MAQPPHQHGQLQVATLAQQPYHGSSYQQQQQQQREPPMGVPLLLPAPPSSSSSSVRRLPPPCWTPDETSCLIDSYRSKWLSLRRSNLRSNHWQDVADDIHSRCPDVSPPKTAVQCRHKMEKLRKRYRAELLRANSIPHHRFKSSWIYFSKMESIDKPSSSSSFPLPLSHAHPHHSTPTHTPTHTYSDFDRSPNYGYGLNPTNYTPKTPYIPTPQSSNNYSMGLGSGGIHDNNNNRKTSPIVVRGSKSKLDEAAFQMADAIRMVGQGFVRMEHMKMDMMRETERLRIDLEMKRTQMILDSQHRILQAFSDIILNQQQHPSS